MATLEGEAHLSGFNFCRSSVNCCLSDVLFACYNFSMEIFEALFASL